MNRRLAAILAADVVDYSRHMGEDQAGTLTALRQLRAEIFEPAVTDHQGTVVKRMGDGWIVEFSGVSDAVNCAIKIQEDLKAHDLFRLRIGVHIGEVVFEEEDVFGDGVNVAARLEALASPGCVLISDTAYNSLDGKSAKQFGGGESLTLKNIARPVTGWWWPSSAPAVKNNEAQPLSLPDKPSIAVLPFENMSGDKDQEYFADGITEDITTALSKIRSLFVVARNSSFTYKDQTIDIRDVGKNLGVRYVLEGSVRKAGNRLRISGQLVDAISGNHMWAERFDGSLVDIFELQDQVTAKVTAAVAPSIRTAEVARACRKGTNSLTAYDLYLQALAKVNLLDREAAYKLLARARSLAPEFAPAYGLEAWSRTLWIYSTNSLDFRANAGKALELARSAMHFDNDPELAGQIGYALAFFEENVELGRDMVNQSLGTAPCLAWLWASKGFLEAFFGDSEEAVKAFETARRLDPIDPLGFRAMCGISLSYILLEQYEKGLRAARDAIEMSPGNLAALRYGAVAAAKLNRHELAAEFTHELLRISPNFSARDWYENMPIRHAHRFDIIKEGMRTAGIPE